MPRSSGYRPCPVETGCTSVMKLRQFFLLLFIALLARGPIAAGQPTPQSIILASTTSVENSGLLAHILPAFTKETGITVHVLAQGTGQALETAARGDADLVQRFLNINMLIMI